MTAGVATFTQRKTMGGLVLVMHDQGIFWVQKMPRRKFSARTRMISQQAIHGNGTEGERQGSRWSLEFMNLRLDTAAKTQDVPCPKMSRAPRFKDKGSPSSLPPSAKSMKSWLRTRLCFRKLNDPSPGPKNSFGNVTKESPPLYIRNVLGTPQAENRCRFSV